MEQLDAWVAPAAAFMVWQSPHGIIDWDEGLQRLKHPTFNYTGSRKTAGKTINDP
jgi:hypothetical protein